MKFSGQLAFSGPFRLHEGMPTVETSESRDSSPPQLQILGLWIAIGSGLAFLGGWLDAEQITYILNQGDIGNTIRFLHWLCMPPLLAGGIGLWFQRSWAYRLSRLVAVFLVCQLGVVLWMLVECDTHGQLCGLIFCVLGMVHFWPMATISPFILLLLRKCRHANRGATSRSSFDKQDSPSE